MRKEYEDELKMLKKRMEDAERFADKLPIFEEVIIRNKYDGKEERIRFGECYKGMHFAWGINRGHFESNSSRTITNYRKEYYDEYLFNIYINTLALYDSHDDHGLADILNKVEVFYFDPLNTRFYATDEQIEPLLDELVEWYEKAKKLAKEERAESQKLKLLRQQEKIQRELAKLERD